ncbi:MAG: MarR family transcriptional regulator [Magnetococcus sp. DMHC-1]|nr:MarR family transcriptional regulator [Magnetococcales bacterium]
MNVSDVRILKIGIASYEDQKAMVLAIARGEFVPNEEAPKIWFSSLESLAQVLNAKNQSLLNLIATSSPASIKELAIQSQRKESNLSRTLKTLERYGLVRMKNRAGRSKVPELTFDQLVFDGIFNTHANKWVSHAHQT